MNVNRQVCKRVCPITISLLVLEHMGNQSHVCGVEMSKTDKASKPVV